MDGWKTFILSFFEALFWQTVSFMEGNKNYNLSIFHEFCAASSSSNGLIKGEAATVGIHVGTKTRPRLDTRTTGVPESRRWVSQGFGWFFFRLVDIELLFHINVKTNHFFGSRVAFLEAKKVFQTCFKHFETFTILETQSRRDPANRRSSDSIRQLGSQISWTNLWWTYFLNYFFHNFMSKIRGPRPHEGRHLQEDSTTNSCLSSCGPGVERWNLRFFTIEGSDFSENPISKSSSNFLLGTTYLRISSQPIGRI